MEPGLCEVVPVKSCVVGVVEETNFVVCLCVDVGPLLEMGSPW